MYLEVALIWSQFFLFGHSSSGTSFSEQTQQPWQLYDHERQFDWNTIDPSPGLDYSPCYNGLYCARLDVPLNWNSSGPEKESHRAAIAVIKLPAKVPVTHEAYGGMIVVNPGGPGESGVDEVLVRGRSIQSIVDAVPLPSQDIQIQGKYFDIIGFDPRGVKYSTPHLKCFPDAFSQEMWLLSRPEYGFMFDSDSAFAIEWTRTEALGRRCTADDGADSIVAYMNTAQVIQDMVAILDAHGEWREFEKEKLLHQSTSRSKRASQILMNEEHTLETLQYWGVSYGSLLGQTFAAMHPDRVARLVIDGVLDPDDYYKGRWEHNLHDSDKIMHKLCEYCFNAGPDDCPLYGGRSAKDIEDLVETLVFGLKTTPLLPLLKDSLLVEPISVTFDDVYLRAINAMANPHAAAEDFFRVLAELKKGNVTELVDLKQAQIDVAASLSHCRYTTDGCMSQYYFGLLGPTPMIECMDSAFHRQGDLSKEDFDRYFTGLTKQSKWFSLAWARHRMSCTGIKAKPAWRFEGNVSAETSHPLLIIGNTHDTVTPLRNAHRVATLFPGSVVMQQDSEGHCSHAMPSTCTAQHVREYFQTGKLPPKGSICQPDYLPFVGSRKASRLK